MGKKEKKMVCEELTESRIEEELKKVKEEKDLIDFMDIVDRPLSIFSGDVGEGVDSDEFNKKESQMEDNMEYKKDKMDNMNIDTVDPSFSPNNFEEKVLAGDELEKSTRERLEDLNSFIREAGKEEQLLNKLAEEERISKGESGGLSQLKPFEKEKENNRLVRIDSDQLEEHLSIEKVNSIRIRKFPGYIYINLGSIERYMSTDRNVKSVSIRFESKEITFDTKEYAESSTIKLNSMVSIMLDDIDRPFKIHLTLLKNYYTDSKRSVKACETEIVLNKDMIERVHNNITECGFLWSPYSSINIVKSVFSFFSQDIADAWCIKANIAFVSAEEQRVLGLPHPSDLYELSRWINFKNYNYTTWYTGFVNIKGNLEGACTIFWRRRFVYWKGYKIVVYNDLSKSLLGTVDLLERTSFNTIDYTILDSESKIKMVSGQYTIDFHFDCPDKFETFKKVLEAIL